MSDENGSVWTCLAHEGSENYGHLTLPAPSATLRRHFHSDHYGGLDDQYPWSNRNNPLLYCSEITAALAINTLGVHPSLVVPLPFNRPLAINGCGSSCSAQSPSATTAAAGTAQAPLYLTLIPANHCPGAAMLLFRLPDGRHVLHCGDMRYDRSMLSNPSLLAAAAQASPATTPASGAGSAVGSKRKASALSSDVAICPVGGGIDEILLDTTYGHPKHTFPSQADSVDIVLKAVGRYMRVDPDDGECGGDGGGGASVASSASASPVKAASNAPQLRDNARYALSAADVEQARRVTLAAPAAGAGVDGSSTSRLTAGSDGICMASPYPHVALHIPTTADKCGGVVPLHSYDNAGSRGTLLPLYHNLQLDAPPRDTDATLVLVSTYVVGKERILIQLARKLRLRIFMPARKLRILELLGLEPRDLAWVTTDRRQASVHVVGMDAVGRAFPYFMPNFEAMSRYREFVNGLHRNGGSGSAVGAASSSSRGIAPSSSASAAVGAAAGEAVVPPPRRLNVEDDDDEAAFMAAIVASAPDQPRMDAAAGGAASDSGSSSSSSTPAGTTLAPVPPTVPLRQSASDRYTRIVGILPTGWVHSSKKKEYTSADGSCVVHLVPYSEHSSFTELCEFVKFLRPRKVTPTVYADEKDAMAIQGRFSGYVNQTAAKRAFLQAFGGAAHGSRGSSGSGGEGAGVGNAVGRHPVPASTPLLSSRSATAADDDADVAGVHHDHGHGGAQMRHASGSSAAADDDEVVIDDGEHDGCDADHPGHVAASAACTPRPASTITAATTPSQRAAAAVSGTDAVTGTVCSDHGAGVDEVGDNDDDVVIVDEREDAADSAGHHAHGQDNARAEHSSSSNNSGIVSVAASPASGARKGTQAGRQHQLSAEKPKSSAGISSSTLDNFFRSKRP